MSRRCHHGSPRHLRAMRPVRPRSGAPDELGAPGIDTAEAPAAEAGLDEPTIDDDAAHEDGPPLAASPVPALPRPPQPEPIPDRLPDVAPRPLPRPMSPAPPPEPRMESDDVAGDHGATAPQLRRFIKSRAYVPMHELRRRFAINGGEDDMTAVEVDRGRVYVGLPEREGRLLGELLRGGDIGVELSMDPVTPVVVGVYPMRPVSRG